jgi:hypothetical protein
MRLALEQRKAGRRTLHCGVRPVFETAAGGVIAARPFVNDPRITETMGRIRCGARRPEATDVSMQDRRLVRAQCDGVRLRR